MAKGQATGEDRDYQVFCRDIMSTLCCRDDALEPFSEDGIDVPIAFAGTTWRLDVALKTTDGRRVAVAECKNWKSDVKQEQVYSFAKKVEDLRRELQVEVAGFFFVHQGYQGGALSVGDAAVGVKLVTCEAGQPEDFHKIDYLRADRKREHRIAERLVFAQDRVPKPTDDASMRMQHEDGTVEEWRVDQDGRLTKG